MNRSFKALAAGISLAAALGTVTASAPRSVSAAAPTGVRLSLVAYSTPKEVYAKLIPAFAATPAGKGVTFDQSYGSSGSQSGAVAAGLPADIVNLALAPDVTRLVQAGVVSSDWQDNAYHGFVTDSVVVFVVRKGNPKHITSWADLIRPGVRVVTPNPFLSGAARWNIIAAYGAQLESGETPAQARAYLSDLFHHVVSQDKSSRDALQTFVSGRGDVLLDYENEAVLAEHQGLGVSYVIPRDTILIQAPLAVVSTSAEPTAARAFVRFLYSVAAQRMFAENGYRPVVPSVLRQFKSAFPTPAGLFTVAYVGGWAKVMQQFFNPTTGLVAHMESGLGVSGGA